jgi:pyridoxal phosphate enzyme (YggS family)
VNDAGALAVAERLAAVRDRMSRAGADPSHVTVVAVTKGFGPEAVAAACDAGLSDIGENYAQELAAKWLEGPRWHFLGGIQRNKIRALAPHVDVWQSVDRPEEGAAIAAHSPGATVLVQVNVSGEPQKAGCGWDDAGPLVDSLRADGLDVRGLMGVGPAGDPEAARLPFRRLAALARSLNVKEVSMGMTADLEVAVQEGSTMVRVGTALFGVRPTSAALRR